MFNKSVFFSLPQKLPTEGGRVRSQGGDSHGGGVTGEEPGRGGAALSVSEAGLPQVHQTVQLPAAGGAHRGAVHTLPRGERQHAPGPHGLQDLHQVHMWFISLDPN